jgi:hypothetical protein
MADVEATPRVRALLTELLQLDDDDAQLPLTVLGNMYRTQLRAPLVRMGELVAGPQLRNTYFIRKLTNIIIDERWPGVHESLALVQPAADALQDRERLARWLDRLSDERFDATVGVCVLSTAYLLARGFADEMRYTPLFNLHRFTWRQGVGEAAGVLELELGADPMVRQMVLELASPGV